MGVSDGVVMRDGRRVAFSLYGADRPRKTIFEYGTPGVRHLSPQLVAAADRANTALLVVDRPGYGDSDRLPGRRVVDVIGDAAAVLDTVGWRRCAVWGGSGGGPHALALAAGLPELVSCCASVVGLAPMDPDRFDWFDGMSPGNVREFEAAADGEARYRPLVQQLATEAVDAIELGGTQVAEDYELPDSDRRALADRRAEAGYVQRMRATYADGIDGWVDDGVAFTRPWGFDLAAIEVPVSIWYGRHDVLGPRSHPEHLLGAIRGAERHELPGGHVLGDSDLDSIYAWLAGQGSEGEPVRRAG
ncbi:alpha/beta fold hydrolase [Jatrophihabitans fulvus]